MNVGQTYYIIDIFIVPLLVFDNKLYHMILMYDMEYIRKKSRFFLNELNAFL